MCVDKYIYSYIAIYMHALRLRIRTLLAALILQMSLP